MKIYSREELKKIINYIKEKHGNDLIAYIDNPIKRGFDKINVDNIEVLSKTELDKLFCKVDEALENKDVESVDKIMTEISNKKIDCLSFFNIDCNFISLLTIKKEKVEIVKEDCNGDTIYIYFIKKHI